MAASPDTRDAVDRLLERHATLGLSPAGMCEMFEVIEDARQRLRKPPVGEDPASNWMGGYLAGWDERGRAMERVAPARRGEVLAALWEWLPDALVISQRDFEVTIAAWHRRAKRNREELDARRRGGVRA